MSRSLPLSTALGERGCLKIARAALNTSAPCLLQVRSYYPAEERLLARESLDHGCYSRVLGSMVPSVPLSFQGPWMEGLRR